MIAHSPLQLAGAVPKAERVPTPARPSSPPRPLAFSAPLTRGGSGPVPALYATYEAARGLVAGNRRVAIDHAHSLIALDRKMHLFVETNVQHAARALPGLLKRPTEKELAA